MEMDFVAVGDTVVDDFIRLKEAEAHCDINNENCTICMRFGDKIPFESSTIVYGVGNAANAAVSAARLGLSTAFISHVGKDERGEKILEHFREEGVDTRYITEDPDVPTNYHYVLWFGAERTILVKQNEYTYIFPKDLPPPKTLYFSSINGNAVEYRNDLISYLEANPDIFFAFQPGVFEIKAAKAFERFYKRAGLIVCNKEESERILGVTGTPEELTLGIQALGTKIAVVTDGVNGVYARDENGKFMHVPMFPDPEPPLQRTGAGDALASTTAAYLTMGKALEESILRGTVNSAYVVQKIGAQAGLLKKETLEKILGK